MIAPLVSLAASLAPTVFQTILGVNQNQQAQDVAPGARPVYEIPDAAKRSLELQRRAAAGNMPGYDTTRESIEAAGANAVLQGSKFGNPNITQAYRGVTSASLKNGTVSGINDCNSGGRTSSTRRLNRESVARTVCAGQHQPERVRAR